MGNDQKDLTGIHEIQHLQAENPETKDQSPEDPFAVNILPEIEKIDSFESLDQIGMMDHPTQEESPVVEPTVQNEPTAQFPPTDDFPTEPIPDETASASGNDDPFAVFGMETNSSTSTSESNPPPFDDLVAEAPITPSAEPVLFESLKNYSEQTSGRTGGASASHYPFHLKMNGTFGPFERDKLLLFLNDHPIGLSSSDLDLQIKSGRVFFPRISEYAAIKLIQELRDSGLAFQIHPSDQEEPVLKESPLSYSYESRSTAGNDSETIDIPVISSGSVPASSLSQIEEVSVVQFVKTEVIEVENSPIIQEVMDRMVEALKQKARFKGGNALLDLRKEITPLRLPSQYQISLKANVVRLS